MNYFEGFHPLLAVGRTILQPDIIFLTLTLLQRETFRSITAIYLK